MKVVRSTPDRLVLRHVPLGPGIALLAVALLPMVWGWALARAGELVGGLVLAIIGLALLFGCFGVFVKIQRITLDRPGDSVEITETGLFGRRTTRHPLQGLQGATLQSTVIKRKPGEAANRTGRARPEPRVWRAALVRNAGPALPLSEAYGSEKTARAAAAAINAWFGSPDA